MDALISASPGRAIKADARGTLFFLSFYLIQFFSILNGLYSLCCIFVVKGQLVGRDGVLFGVPMHFAVVVGF